MNPLLIYILTIVEEEFRHGLMNKEVIPKKNLKRNMFFMQKTHSLNMNPNGIFSCYN